MSKVLIKEVLYEVQIRSPFGTFEHGSSKWFDSDHKNKTKNDFILPEGWLWLSDWKTLGEDSWEYSNHQQGPWVPYPGIFTNEHIRRKQWNRIRGKLNVSKDELKDIRKSCILTEDDEILQSIKKDISKQADELKCSAQILTSHTAKPNILLLGGSGAGKSTIVNGIFGKTLAEIGDGRPITQTYTKYSGTNFPVTIYDSRGIEHGYAEKGFIDDTILFFKKIHSQPELENHIHVVWYVIDLTQARFQPFEASFCKTYLIDYPIIFVLNKADSVSKEVIDIMIKVIRDFSLPNCHGIFPTVACLKNFETIKKCEKCQSVRIKKKMTHQQSGEGNFNSEGGTCTVICKDCNANYLVKKTEGLEALERATLTHLPDFVKQVFINSVKQSLIAKETEAKRLILYYATVKSSLQKTSNTGKDLQEMCKSLIKIYGMEVIKNLLSDAILRKYGDFFEENRALTKWWMQLQDFFGSKTAFAFFLVAGLEICKIVNAFKEKVVIALAARDMMEIHHNEKKNTVEEDAMISPTKLKLGSMTSTTGNNFDHAKKETSDNNNHLLEVVENNSNNNNNNNNNGLNFSGKENVDFLKQNSIDEENKKLNGSNSSSNGPISSISESLTTTTDTTKNFEKVNGEISAKSLTRKETTNEDSFILEKLVYSVDLDLNLDSTIIQSVASIVRHMDHQRIKNLLEGIDLSKGVSSILLEVENKK